MVEQGAESKEISQVSQMITNILSRAFKGNDENL